MEYLAQSESALMEVRLEEVFGVPEQQNLPGTQKEHPNWRVKLPSDPGPDGAGPGARPAGGPAE